MLELIIYSHSTDRALICQSFQDSIIPSLQDPVLQQTVNILITLHVVLALTIVFNPLNQELEELFNVPQGRLIVRMISKMNSKNDLTDFGWQRIVSRSGMMLAVVFVAETVPNFGVLLDLVGGSTITVRSVAKAKSYSPLPSFPR